MSALTIELPAYILRQVEELAHRDGISVTQFLAAAAAERVSALRSADYLRSEAAQGQAEDWNYVLDRVPARAPLPQDEP